MIIRYFKFLLLLSLLVFFKGKTIAQIPVQNGSFEGTPAQ
jgi:hypothetical protein